ncbi:hypothetical protein A4X13_0g7790 [Tilletia indica]|uniref:Uncharacterized protein n=1 Tax=Tilletia indica TaxID=43049 RepID=A0A8T8SHM3_9BASI|nr:hypothetical protein A4X13_0g7790 [Tilletia indica]
MSTNTPTIPPQEPTVSASPAPVVNEMDRAFAQQTAQLREMMRAEFATNRAEIAEQTERLDQICARLDVLEARTASNTVDVSVETAGDSSTSSIPVPSNASTTALLGAAPATTVAQAPPVEAPAPASRLRDSARDAWNDLPAQERSAWRAFNAGVGTSAPPTTVTTAPIAVATAPVAPTTTFPSSGRPLQCKPDLLPKFDGDPKALEVWISRVRDLVRTNRDPSWDIAVVAAIPNAFTGAAARWHAALDDDQIEEQRSVADVFKALRKAFPVNRSTIRADAHLRKWRPRSESAMMYAYDKLSMLRTAYKSTPPTELTLSDIIDGLEDTMKPMIRVDAETASMDDLVHELCRWEPVWRSIHKVQLEKHESDTVHKAASNDKSVNSSAKSSRPAPVATAPKPAGERRPPFNLGRYDPSRVVEATATEKRMYKREDGSMMRLNRPCGRCGDDHFDFEHAYLKEGARSFPMVAPADYEVVEAAVDSDSDF